MSPSGAATAVCTVHDLDGETVVEATRDGDTLHVTVTGPKRVAGVEFAPVAGAPVRAVITSQETP